MRQAYPRASPCVRPGARRADCSLIGCAPRAGTWLVVAACTSNLLHPHAADALSLPQNACMLGHTVLLPGKSRRKPGRTLE